MSGLAGPDAGWLLRYSIARLFQHTRAPGLKIHPARFPAALSDFFIRLLTEEGDIVVDPFCGSNTTGAVAERLGRRWLAIESVESYLEGSRFRFA